MEAAEDYRARLSAAGMLPLNKLVEVMECRLADLSRRQKKAAAERTTALFSGLGLLALAGAIYLFERQPFLSLLPAALAAMALCSWWGHRFAEERLVRELFDLETLLRRANFDLSWSEQESHKPAVRWRTKEARFYA